MEIPSFTYTTLIVNYLIKIETLITDIDNINLPKKYLRELIAQQDIKALHQLSKISGNDIGYDQATKVQSGSVLPSSKNRLRLFTNFRNFQEFKFSYDKEHSILPSIDLAAHINKLVASKLYDEWETGKFRSFSDLPQEDYDQWYHLRGNYPNTELETYFNNLLTELVNPKYKHNPFIRVAILLYEFMDKSPLTALNQITAMAVSEIYIKYFNKSCDSTFSIVPAIYRIDEDLSKAFKISKENGDLTTFIEAVLYVLSLEYLELQQSFRKVMEQDVKRHADLGDKLNQRQIKILDYLEINKRIKRKEYKDMMGVSFMTAYRDLQELVDEEFLIQKGKGRGTHYALANPIENSEDGSDELPKFGSIDEVN